MRRLLLFVLHFALAAGLQWSGYVNHAWAAFMWVLALAIGIALVVTEPDVATRLRGLTSRRRPDAATPALSIGFKPGVPPFFEEQRLPHVTDRRFRVAVENASGSVIQGVMLRLEWCNHPEKSGIHLEHRFQVMETGEDSASIPAESRAIFDVVTDQTPAGTGALDELRMCYAVPVENRLDRSETWRIVLRAESGAFVARQAFLVRATANGRIEMFPVPA